MRHAVSAAALAVAALAAPAAIAGSAVVSLSGANFLQSGSVLNTSNPGISLTSLRYSLGTQEAGVAVWQIFASTGVHSDFFAGDRYSTETWFGLGLAPGANFNFSGLDIDLIVTVVPPVASDVDLDFVGTSLRNATVTAFFSDGSSASAALNQTGWTTDQRLELGSFVPEPGTWALSLAGLALLGGLARRRQQA